MDLIDADSPEARFARGGELLRQGRWAEGFRLYEAWREVPERRKSAGSDFAASNWRGEDVAGSRFLIVGEEGLGDQIMYARFAALLRDRGAEVVWLCLKPLARLLGRCLGVHALTPEGAGDLGSFHFHAQSSELPALFFPPLAEPSGAPYLTPPVPNVLPGRSVGVVTRGNPKHQNDANRSLPPDASAELLALPGAVSLLPEDTGAQDFYDTATVIAGLDLVITVDTSVAHLAGALGKPVWILLPALNTDWRWMTERADSAWYNSARLFRQTTPGDWSSVLSAVRVALGEFVAHDVRANG